VSQTLTSQEVQTNALGKAREIAATARDLDTADSILLNAVLEDRFDDWKSEVAWIQITDGGGHSLAVAGTPPHNQSPETRPRDQSRGGRGQGPRPDMENANTEKGRVTIARVPLPPPGSRTQQRKMNNSSGGRPNSDS